MPSEDFVPKVCNAFKKAVESASEVKLEGREREFRRGLARHLFDEILGWEDHSKVGEIYDITCFDEEKFPIIVVETKWGVEPTPEIKEKLRKHIEELGSVKYGVFASERDLIVYEYKDYELKETTEVNVAQAVWVAKGEFGLSELGKKRILRLELLKRERLVWVEEPEYFEKTYKEVSLARGKGVELLTQSLKLIVSDLTLMLMTIFDSYCKRKDHYSGKFLGNTFDDWLKTSMKKDEFENVSEKKDEIRRKIIEVFCRETAYVLLGKVLFTRICEDKDIIETIISGKGIAESLKYYGKREMENVYLRLFNDSREKIKKYYSHFQVLGYFDWWITEEVLKESLSYDERKTQHGLERELDYSLKKAIRRLNRFDFSEVNRDVLGDVYQGYLPPEERKRLGEFYTPIEVIKYILDAVGYKPENEIRGKKLLDPACGSGSFIVEATRRLIERYRRIGFNLGDPDDAKQVVEGCVSSIYGLDIHPFASFIAEMNLLFQLVDLYDVVRLKERYYELPRLNTFRTDSLAPSGAPIELAEFFDNSRLRALMEETKGADKVKNLRFDYVVGNPPYVRKERIPTEYKEKVLMKVFPEIYHGDNDIYVYFIAKGIVWLNNEGKLGYIVSRKFTKTRYGANIRKYISDTCYIEQFLDFADTETFSDVTNYPCIFVLTKGADNLGREKHQIKSILVKKESTELLKDISKRIDAEKFSDDYVEIYKVPQTTLGSERWRLEPFDIREVFTKIRMNSELLLGDVCHIDKGIYTALDKTFVVDEMTVQKFGLERELLRPTLKGEDVRRYKIVSKKLYLIYTKDVDIEKYPSTKGYLERFRNELEKRWCVTDPSMRRKWFELEKPRSPELYESEKIITPDISNRNNFTIDQEGYYPLATCFVLNPKSEFKQYAGYFLGLLNSKIMEFYFRQVSTFLRRKYYRYIKQYLEQLPIKKVTDDNKYSAEEISQNVRQILQLNGQINIIKDKIKGFPYSYFENNWDFDKLANITKAHNISRESYPISEKSLRTDYKQRDLDGSETFRIILAPDEFVDFHSDNVATYIFEVLRKINGITKRGLLELKIPQQPHIRDLMSQYRKDKEQLAKNEKTIDALEKQIDNLVYKLYGITERHDMKIIEDYLKEF